MTQPHAQFNAVSAIGGGDWTVICNCREIFIRPTLAEADTAHAAHVEVERRIARAPKRIERVA